MDPKVTREIIKTTEDLRKKFRSMKRGIEKTQEGQKHLFAPLLRPLEDIRKALRKKPSEPKAEQPKTEKIQQKFLMEDLETPDWQSTVISEDMSTPVFHKKSPSFYRKSTLIPKVEDITVEPTMTPAAMSSTTSYNEPPDKEEEEEEAEEEYETEEPLVEKIREYVKTPQGEEELNEHLNTAGPLQKKYLAKLFKGGKDLDNRYGLRVMPNGGLAIGDSTNVQLLANSNDVSINNVIYEGTPGLLQLLYLKNPQDYTDADLKNYKNILFSTNAHKKGYSQEMGIFGTRSDKYKNVISKLFSTVYLRGSSSSSPASKTSRLQSLRSFKRGTGLMTEGVPIYEYWNDPNELVDRLRMLIASSQAGHEGHQNEIESIIEELREEGIIY